MEQRCTARGDGGLNALNLVSGQIVHDVAGALAAGRSLKIYSFEVTGEIGGACIRDYPAVIASKAPNLTIVWKPLPNRGKRPG